MGRGAGAGVDGWDDGGARYIFTAQSTIEGGSIPSTQHPSHLCTNNTPQSLKGYESWDPSDPDGKKTAKPIRSLDEN